MRDIFVKDVMMTLILKLFSSRLQVRYPLVFGKTFPLIKGLVQNSEAGMVLEGWEVKALRDKLAEELKLEDVTASLASS